MDAMNHNNQYIAWNGIELHPHHYVILQDGLSIRNGAWNASSEKINFSLDGLVAGGYNFTCVLYDGTGNSFADTAIVIVNEITTTPTTPTTTGPTTTGPSTTPGPTGGDPLGLTLIVAGGAGVVAVILIIVMMMEKET